MLKMLKRGILLLITLFLTVGALRLPAQESEFLTPESVQKAIDGGIAYLRKNQRGGAWEEYPGYDPGTTSLCLLALLSAELPTDDKTVAAGLDYLVQFTPETQKQTYPIALQTMVFCQADPQRFRPQIEANVEWLLAHQFKTDNQYNGGWSYTGLDQTYSMADNSNSQFAVLALYESEKAGIKIPDEVWKSIEDYWVRLQNPDGSWGYRANPRIDALDESNRNKNKSGKGTGSMTCAGIVALLVSDVTRVEGASVSNTAVNCCTDNGADENRKRIERGFDWLAKNFSVRTNPGTPANADTYIFYYLYGLERTGRLTARRYIGQGDWYREGADYLLRRKKSYQFWNAGTSPEKVNVVATSFALLFLSKGRWPVLVSKLKYGEPGADDWNRHPNDLDHLTRYTERNWNRKLTWQVIDSEKAGADDYSQTPVLALSGRHSPLPADAAAQRTLAENLRAYLDRGGFILAEALDGDESFETGFRELMKEVFPEEEDGGLKLLPENHPIWTQEQTVPPKFIPTLYGIDLGCRTGVIFIPAPREETAHSLSCLWELADDLRRGPAYAESVETEIKAGLDLGLNILAYATGHELKYKEEIPQTLEQDEPESRHPDFYASILDLGNGSPCAPRAIPNLMSKIKSEYGIPIQTAVRSVRLDRESLGTAPLLFLHGRSAFTLSDEEAAQLRSYFDWGGFLFVNAVCASQPFANSFAAEIKKVFPDGELEPIPADDPLFSDRYGGWNIDKLEIRNAKNRNGETVAKMVVPPRLYGIKKENRWVVVFSPYDISCALESGTSSRCPGWSPDSAYKLAVNAVFYAMEHL